MRVNMNGLRTELATNKKTLFVALPPELWRPIQGGCGCPFCKSHPDLIPHWDTLVVNPVAGRAKGQIGPMYSDTTSTCHYPEFANPTGNPWTAVE